MLDFTIQILMELYKNLVEHDYKIMPFFKFLQGNHDRKICILRHDVDRGAKSALRLACLERKNGIRASYYFRYPAKFCKRIIKEVDALGHEIGYHYEVLTKAKGDYELAIRLFKKELEEFRKIINIKTICAHGSPLSKYDNRSLWDKYNFTDFGISGEIYRSVDFNEVLYLTDTGRCWNSDIGNIRDKVTTDFNYAFFDTNELITAVKKNMLPDKIIINIHPNRWSDNFFKWGVELVGQNIKNFIKCNILHHGHI